jgi:glycosyltransferase involved in cell wall biosynthesis
VAARYVEAPSDEEVNGLLGRATVVVQTSRHEGFGLPMLEAMAAGTPLVCTDAHGNRDFCRDGVNCLMPDPTPEAVAEAIGALVRDPALRERLATAGRATARQYDWNVLIERIEGFYESLAPSPASASIGAAEGARVPGAG